MSNPSEDQLLATYALFQVYGVPPKIIGLLLGLKRNSVYLRIAKARNLLLMREQEALLRSLESCKGHRTRIVPNEVLDKIESRSLVVCG